MFIVTDYAALMHENRLYVAGRRYRRAAHVGGKTFRMVY